MSKRTEPSLLRQVIGTVIVTMLLVAAFLFIAKPALSDTGRASGTSATSGGNATVVRPRMPADPPYSPHRGARKFRHHKLGTAKNWTIPRHFKRKINHWVRRHGGVAQARRGCCGWWKFPFDASRCIYWTGRIGWCSFNAAARAGVALTRDMRHVAYVAGGCSLGAFVGHYIYKVWDPAYQTWKITRHGWLAIGAGATACTWQLIYDKWFE